MSIRYVIIVLGEPNSVFSEIIGKYKSKKKILKKRIIIIGNKSLFCKQLKKLGYFIKINEIKNIKEAKVNIINLINIEYKHRKIFSKISTSSSKYIEKCFNKSLEIIKKYKTECILINGPISKKTFLKKKYLGITEYLSKKTNCKNEVMLIYNKKLSVSPITTHIPVKHVSKNISKKKILNNILSINKFYKETLNMSAKFAILGLNPHCETIDKYSEEDKIITPTIQKLKKRNVKIEGPFAADTFFFKDNLDKFNVVIGMYHDQVLTPIKTIYGFDAINITLGLPFIRISPDHGPNSKMLGKNISNPNSFYYAMTFINNLK